MSFTTNKKLSAQAAASASGTWGAGGTTGVDLNTGVIGPLDTILGGTSTITATNGTYSLTFTSGGGGDVNNAHWRFTATLLGNLTVSPTVGDATTYLNGYYNWSNTTTGSFTITLTTADGSVVLPQGRRGVLYVSTAANIAPVITAIAGSSTADPIPSGTVMLFYQNAAPSGWTIVATQNNKALRVVSSAGGVAGGTNSFSTVMAQTTTGSHTLTSAEMPAHTHAALGGGSFYQQSAGTTPTAIGSGSGSMYVGATTASTGSGGSHSHTFMMDIAYIDVILCSRD